MSASMKCWCTMPMPAAIASAGLGSAPRGRRPGSRPRRAGACRRASSSASTCRRRSRRRSRAPRRGAPRSSMSRFATTPGNRLVMPRSSTAYGRPPAVAPAAAPSLLCGQGGPSSPGRRGCAPALQSRGGGITPSADSVRRRRRRADADPSPRILSHEASVRDPPDERRARAHRPGPPWNRSGRGPPERTRDAITASVGTVISPSTIFCLYSSMSLLMSSMKPPEVARPTPSVDRSLTTSVPPLTLPSTKSTRCRPGRRCRPA